MINCDLNYIKDKKEKEEMRKFLKNYQRKEQLEVLSIENGVILPRKEADPSIYPNTWMGLGGVLDSEGNFVKISGIKALWEDDFVFGGKYECEESIEKCEEDVIYMGVFQPQWGHFLLEYCTRLWYALQSEDKCKIVYCGYGYDEGTYPKVFQEFFDLLGLREQLVDIRKPMRFKKIIIPEQSFLRNQYFTAEYRFIMDTAYKNIKKAGLIPYEKIYFSRVRFIEENAPHRECGEKEIQDTFDRNGYKIFFPETLSVSEQIFYVRNCKVFAAVMGSASTNFVFASDNTEVIYIRKAPYVAETFQIDQSVNAKRAILVDSFFRPYKQYPRSYGGGPHFIGVTKQFKLFLKNNNMTFLSERIYITSILRTWLWLTKIAGKNLANQYKERKNIHKVKSTINVLLEKTEKFIIYPYGKIGNIAKSILDEKGITTYILVDHYKSLTDKSVYDINVLNYSKYSDYLILMCSDSKSQYYKTIKSTVYNSVNNKERIIEVL